MSDENQTPDLTSEVRALRAEVAKLNNHRYIVMHDKLFKLGMFQLFRGLAFGLGSVLGATILVSVAAFLLAQIDFIPIIGDWAGDIAREIDAGNAESFGVVEDSDQPGDDANLSPGEPPAEESAEP